MKKKLLSLLVALCLVLQLAGFASAQPLKAPIDTQSLMYEDNLALGVLPTVDGPVAPGDEALFQFATDGSVENQENPAPGKDPLGYLNIHDGFAWVVFDLGASYDLTSAKMWHYYPDGRIYRDLIIQISDDPTFQTGVETVFNNDKDNSLGFGAGADDEYAESKEGKLVTFEAKGRYVRTSLNGSNKNGGGQLVEFQVFTPVVMGDINLDKQVDDTDCTLIQQYYAGWRMDLSNSALKSLDFDRDKALTLTDKILAARVFAEGNGSFLPDPNQKDDPVEPPENPYPLIKIMPIGDSITYTGTTWRADLLKSLKTAGYHVEMVGNYTDSASAHQGMNGAVTGPGESWGSSDTFQNNVYDNIDSFMQKDPDVALMLIGVNDFSNYQGASSSMNNDGKAHERLEVIVRKMLTIKPELSLVLASLTPVASDKFYSNDIPSYNAKVEELVTKLSGEGYDVHFADMFRLSGIDGDNPSEEPDGLHPAEPAQLKMSNVWYNTLTSFLKIDSTVPDSAEVVKTECKNGTVEVTFDKLFHLNASDFSLTAAADGAQAQPLAINRVRFSAVGNKAVLSFAPFEGVDEGGAQVDIGVSYQGKVIATEKIGGAVTPLDASVGVGVPASIVKGDVFDATFSITVNPGVSEFQVTISYDPSVIELTEDDVSAGSVLQGARLMSNVKDIHRENGKVIVSLFDYQNHGGKGAMFKLPFKAVATGSCDITAAFTSMTNYSEERLAPVIADVTGATAQVKGVSFDALNDLIKTAGDKAAAGPYGDKNGEYPPSAKTELETAIAAAKAVAGNPDAAQEQIDKAEGALQQAVKTFEAQKIAVSYKALNDMIKAVDEAILTANVGAGNGQYPAAAMSELQKAVNAARDVLNTTDISQAAVDSAYNTLKTSLSDFYDSVIKVDTTSLNKIVSQAQSKLKNAEIGDKKGQYPKAAAQKLQAAIEEALRVMNKTGVTDEEVKAAENALSLAIEVFAGSVVTAGPSEEPSSKPESKPGDEPGGNPSDNPSQSEENPTPPSGDAENLLPFGVLALTACGALAVLALKRKKSI